MARSFDIFEAVRTWERRLLPMLAAAPIVELVALVDEDGVDGRINVDGNWNIDVCCPLWRIAGCAIQNRDLTLRRPVTHAEFRKFRQSIRPDSIVRVWARLVDERRIGSPQAQLESFEDADSADLEMMNLRDKRRGSVRIDDQVFGIVAFDDSRGVFWTITDWCGQPVRLELDAEKRPGARRALQMAQKLWQSQIDWDGRIWDRILGKLLPLKNDRWLCESEASVTAQDFRERVTLSTVEVNPEGNFEFWHCDGFLFLDHSIVVDGSLDAGVRSASIVG